VVCNTLLRKAAEQGGVHPLELDRTSSLLARRIEEQTAVEPLLELMQESARRYCRLVRGRSLDSSSPTVRRAIACIQSDLAGDLSLHSLAATLSVNASYLSALFRRETGRTVTDYVTGARMELAARLLRSTNLQIQTVAQHCGMSDVNYFSKLFKKTHGITPKQFRDYCTEK
jgi:YesN/AraC family two-component response regulator